LGVWTLLILIVGVEACGFLPIKVLLVPQVESAFIRWLDMVCVLLPVECSLAPVVVREYHALCLIMSQLWRGARWTTGIEVDITPWRAQQVHHDLLIVIQRLVLGRLLLVGLAAIV
jgi:hypothetical protein